MNMLRIFSLLIAVGCLAELTPAHACTTFFMSDGAATKIMGKSYDWDMEHGMVVINKRGMAKHALLANRSATPATWQSRFASLTFNQYGREFPNGGINEAGLAIEVMYLDSSQYPANPTRPVINEMQWIQYQLDRFDSVREMSEHAEDISIIPVAGKVHYLACDVTLACASFEFIQGRMVVHGGNELPAKTLTNNSYTESISYLKQFQGFGGNRPIVMDHDDDSLARFMRASHLATKFNPTTMRAVPYAFDIIENVMQGEFTKWRIVYDLAAGRVYFRTRTVASIKYVDLKNINTSCTAPVMTLNLATDHQGDVWPLFKEYSFDENYQIVETSLQNTPPLPIDDAVTKIAQFPESFVCHP